MRIYALCVYLFLYTPIAIIALFSFNARPGVNGSVDIEDRSPT